MPPKIGSLPKHLPHALRLDIRRLSYSSLDFTSGFIWRRMDLEYFNALSAHPTTEIDLIAMLGLWPETFDKPTRHHLIFLRFKFTEGHTLDHILT